MLHEQKIMYKYLKKDILKDQMLWLCPFTKVIWHFRQKLMSNWDSSIVYDEHDS